MSEPIRVLHVFGALDAGGVENFVMNLYRRIDRTKVQFDFAMTHGRPGIYDEEVLGLGGRIFYLDGAKTVRENLRELMEKERFDVIHSHVFFYSGLVLQEANRAGVPIRIAHAHNAYTGEHRSPIRIVYENYMRFLIRRNATLLLGCSAKACQYVFGKGSLHGPKVSVLPDGIDCGRFAFNPVVREEMRNTLGLDGKFVIGHVGHFAPAKNHKKILSVFCELVRAREDAALLLVGDGALENQVRQRVQELKLEDRVIFAGAHADVERYYQAMDVFLFPSVFEGFGMAMIEAQANGLSCVASTVVPEKTNVTGNCAYLPLDETDKVWAAALLRARLRDTTSEMTEQVKKTYDSSAASDLMQGIYLNEEKER